MALLMGARSEPTTEEEIVDLDAIAALKESAATELKEEGNQFVKKGKKHYKDAIDCYTRAINQKALGNFDTSLLFSNRALVNLLMGNYRRALTDAEEAIRLFDANEKAYYRAAKAAFSLKLFSEALSFCTRGLEQFPTNEEFKKLLLLISTQKAEEDRHRDVTSEAISAAKDLARAIDKRGLQFGKASYQELTGLRKPRLDKSGTIHWPVLFLYAEVMSSDFIEDFCETDNFASHIDVMFSESSEPLPWDRDRAYTRDVIELYYQAGIGSILPQKEVIRYLLQGTVDSNVLDEYLSDQSDALERCNSPNLQASKDYGKWIKVNERSTLLDALKQPGFLIPAIPVFFVVSKKSSFYNLFKAGKWSAP